MTKVVLFRRKGLGKECCVELAKLIKQYVGGIEVEVIRNDRPHPHCYTIIRWGCTSEYKRYSQRTLNKSSAIHTVNDKRYFRYLINKDGLCPRTFFFIQDFRASSLDYPVIVRPATHAQGKQLHLCNDTSQLVAACSLYPSYYISEYIPKVAEYRVCFMGGRVVWVAEKQVEDKSAVAWNVSQGNSKFENVRWKQWPMAAIAAAHKALLKVEGLFFGGVDVMVDSDGRAYVLEINSAPALTSPYRKQCTARGLAWAVQDKEVDPVVSYKKYKDVIHPSLLAYGEENDG